MHHRQRRAHRIAIGIFVRHDNDMLRIVYQLVYLLDKALFYYSRNHD